MYRNEILIIKTKKSKQLQILNITKVNSSNRSSCIRVYNGISIIIIRKRFIATRRYFNSDVATVIEYCLPMNSSVLKIVLYYTTIQMRTQGGAQFSSYGAHSTHPPTPPLGCGPDQ